MEEQNNETAEDTSAKTENTTQEPTNDTNTVPPVDKNETGASEPPAPPVPPVVGNKSKVIRIALADNHIMWSTPDKSIELSAFTQKTGAEVPLDHVHMDKIQNAIRMGLLIELSNEIEYPTFKTKELTYGKKLSDEEVIKKTYNTEEYLNMLQEEVIEKIGGIDDPNLVIKLIQAEKVGNNKDKATRQNVISALRTKLKQININGVYDIELDDL